VKYRFFIGLFIAMIAAPTLWAANISVLVMELGENRENMGPNQYAYLWENGLLDALFDSGHIVTNSPHVQIEAKPSRDIPVEAERDLRSAREGGMDFFLIALIDYTTPLISLRLFDIKTTKMVLEQKHALVTVKNNKDENDRIHAAARVMAAQLR